MALPEEADVRLILSRIRPAADWGWRGGALNDPANLRWRDQVQPEPTLLELEAEWTVIAAERVAATTVRQQLKAEYAPLVGRPFSSYTNPEGRLVIEILFYLAGGLDEKTRLAKSAKDWQAAREILDA